MLRRVWATVSSPDRRVQRGNVLVYLIILTALFAIILYGAFLIWPPMLYTLDCPDGQDPMSDSSRRTRTIITFHQLRFDLLLYMHTVTAADLGNEPARVAANAVLADVADDAARAKALDFFGGDALFNSVQALRIGVPDTPCQRRFVIAAILREIDRRLSALIELTIASGTSSDTTDLLGRITPVGLSASLLRLSILGAAADAAAGASSALRASAAALHDRFERALGVSLPGLVVPPAYGGPLADAALHNVAVAASYVVHANSFASPTLHLTTQAAFERLFVADGGPLTFWGGAVGDTAEDLVQQMSLSPPSPRSGSGGGGGGGRAGVGGGGIRSGIADGLGGRTRAGGDRSEAASPADGGAESYSAPHSDQVGVDFFSWLEGHLWEAAEFFSKVTGVGGHVDYSTGDFVAFQPRSPMGRGASPTSGANGGGVGGERGGGEAVGRGRVGEVSRGRRRSDTSVGGNPRAPLVAKVHHDGGHPHPGGGRVRNDFGMLSFLNSSVDSLVSMSGPAASDGFERLALLDAPIHRALEAAVCGLDMLPRVVVFDVASLPPLEGSAPPAAPAAPPTSTSSSPESRSGARGAGVAFDSSAEKLTSSGLGEGGAVGTARPPQLAGGSTRQSSGGATVSPLRPPGSPPSPAPSPGLAPSSAVPSTPSNPPKPAATFPAECYTAVTATDHNNALCNEVSVYLEGPSAVEELRRDYAWDGLLVRTLSGKLRANVRGAAFAPHVCELACDDVRHDAHDANKRRSGAVSQSEGVGATTATPEMPSRTPSPPTSSTPPPTGWSSLGRNSTLVEGIDLREWDRGVSQSSTALYISLAGRRLSRQLLLDAKMTLPCWKHQARRTRARTSMFIFLLGILIMSVVLVRQLTRLQHRATDAAAAERLQVMVDDAVADLVEDEIDAMLAVLQPRSVRVAEPCNTATSLTSPPGGAVGGPSPVFTPAAGFGGRAGSGRNDPRPERASFGGGGGGAALFNSSTGAHGGLDPTVLDSSASFDRRADPRGISSASLHTAHASGWHHTPTLVRARNVQPAPSSQPGAAQAAGSSAPGSFPHPPHSSGAKYSSTRAPPAPTAPRAPPRRVQQLTSKSRTVRDAQLTIRRRLRELRRTVACVIVPHLPPSMWSLSVDPFLFASKPTATATDTGGGGAGGGGVGAGGRRGSQTPQLLMSGGVGGGSIGAPLLGASAMNLSSVAGGGGHLDVVKGSRDGVGGEKDPLRALTHTSGYLDQLTPVGAPETGLAASSVAVTVKEHTVAVILLPAREDRALHEAVEAALTAFIPSERGVVQYLSPTEVVAVWPQASRQAANAVAAVYATAERITAALLGIRRISLRCTAECQSPVLCRARALKGEFGAGLATTFAASGFFGTDAQRIGHMFGPAIDDARSLATLALMTGAGILATDSCMQRGGCDRAAARPFEVIALPTKPVFSLAAPTSAFAAPGGAARSAAAQRAGTGGVTPLGPQLTSRSTKTAAGGVLDALLQGSCGGDGSTKVHVIERLLGPAQEDCEWMYSAAVAEPSAAVAAYNRAFHLLSIGAEQSVLLNAKKAVLSRNACDFLTKRLLDMIDEAVDSISSSVCTSPSVYPALSMSSLASKHSLSVKPSGVKHGPLVSALPRDFVRRRLPWFTPWDGDLFAAL